MMKFLALMYVDVYGPSPEAPLFDPTIIKYISSSEIIMVLVSCVSIYFSPLFRSAFVLNFDYVHCTKLEFQIILKSHVP